MSFNYKKYWEAPTFTQIIEKNKVEETVLSEPKVQVEVVVAEEPIIEEVIVVIEEPKKKKDRRKK